MDNGANYMGNNKNGKIIVKEHQQQWGCVKDQDSFSSDQFQIWPAKNYACNFCRREFKSAQALGGHMNVHRRDRARLRLFPSWVAVADNNNNNNDSNNSNNNSSYPNPNFSLSTPPTSCFTFRSSNNNSLSSSSTQDQDLKKSAKPSSGPQDYDHIDDVLHVFKKKKKSNLLTLELKMGDNFEANSNEDGLDLELHL